VGEESDPVQDLKESF
jgi:hypothetical protein